MSVVELASTFPSPQTSSKRPQNSSTAPSKSKTLLSGFQTGPCLISSSELLPAPLHFSTADLISGRRPRSLSRESMRSLPSRSSFVSRSARALCDWHSCKASWASWTVSSWSFLNLSPRPGSSSSVFPLERGAFVRGNEVELFGLEPRVLFFENRRCWSSN